MTETSPPSSPRPTAPLGTTTVLHAVILVFVIIVACGSPPPPPKPQEGKPASGKLETFNLTEIHDGDKRWVLEADHADFLKEQSQINIRGIRMEFYGFSPGPLKLTCQEGHINTASREVSLKGGINMQLGDLQIKTESVIYQPTERLLWAPEQLTVETPKFTITGKGLRLDVRRRHLNLMEHHLTTIKMAGQQWPL